LKVSVRMTSGWELWGRIMIIVGKPDN